MSDSLPGGFQVGPATAAAPSVASPIADLSYRGYDGPLQNRTLRWWIIALANIRMSIRKVPFWILAALSSGGYLFSLIILWFRSRAPAGLAGPGMGNIRWVDYVMTGLPVSLFFLFLLTLMTGAGSISSDNRANALLVYLSKPITKADYLVGKWMGIFTLLFAVAFAPALLVYAYGAMSFSDQGFFSSDRLLLAKVGVVSAVAAGLHTSLIMAFSAWSRSSRMAGALYAGFYFLSVITTGILTLILAFNAGGGRGPQFDEPVVRTVNSLSVPRLIEGLAQHIYGRGAEGFATVLSQGVLDRALPKPELWVVLPVVLALVVLSLFLAHARIRAVEIVRG